MTQFVQSLESRRLLSSVGLIAAEAQLVSDVKTFAGSANSARVTVGADAKAVAGDLKALHVGTTTAGKALASAVSSAKTTIRTDVEHMFTAGSKDGFAIIGDLVKIYFGAGNPTKVAKAQVKLAADIKALSTAEQPYISKLESDIGKAETAIGADVQALVNANKSDAQLQTDWSSLQTAFNSAQTTLTTDFGNVQNDVNAVIAAAG